MIKRGTSLSEYCKLNNLDILKYWDYDKNRLDLFITPDSVACKSAKEVW